MTKQELYQRYGTTTPESEYEQVYDEETGNFKYIPVKQLVDAVRKRIDELEARREKSIQIQRCRKYNLKLKAEKQKEIKVCRIENMISEINKKSTI